MRNQTNDRVDHTTDRRPAWNKCRRAPKISALCVVTNKNRLEYMLSKMSIKPGYIVYLKNIDAMCCYN